VPGLDRHEIELHGHRLVYRTAGSGPVVLLVHGLLDSGRTWRKLAPALALGHRVIAPDLLGHGESDGPTGVDYSLGGHAGILRDLLDALDVERVTIVGHSLGGGIAMTFAYHYPERVERIALVSSGGLGRGVSSPLRAATLPGAGAVMRTIGARPVVACAGAFASALAALRLRHAARVTLELVRTLDRLGDSGRRGAFLNTVRAVIDGHGQKVSALDRLALLGRMPVLVIWGTNDRVIPAEHAELVRERLEHAEVVLLDGIGHTPHLSQPAYVGERLAAWIRGTGPEPEGYGIESEVARPTFRS
jgi:pimeloyl-ACP methyl ester carboxylesterase